MFRKKFGLIALLLCIVLAAGYFAINTGAVSTVLLAIQGAITDGNLIKFSGINGIGVDTGLSATNVADAVTKKHTQNTDTDLDTTFEATFVKKADNVNILNDITSPGADIEDAVTKRHTQNTDTALGIQTQDLNMGTHKIIGVVDPANPQDAATKAYADTKVATEVDPMVDTDAEIKAILVDEVTKTGTLTVGNLTKTNNATGVIEDAGVATETALTTDSDAKVPTSKAVNDFCETTKDYKGKNYYSALSTDHTYSDNADTDSQAVGESVVFGDLLYFNWTDKEWKKAKADVAGTTPGLRIALESKADSEACLMLVKGYIRDDSAFEFAGAMVYVSETTAGAMTSTAPSTAGNQLQRVGQAKSADILFFDPSIDQGEI